MKPAEARPASALRARCLLGNLLAPGLGHWFSGAVRAAGLWTALWHASTLLALRETVPRSRASYLFAAALGSVWLAAVLHAGLGKLVVTKLRWHQRLWWLPVGAILWWSAWGANLFWLAPWRPYQVPSHSMRPTLQRGDVFLMSKRRWPHADVRRGDVVVFERIEHGERLTLVKRVVALGGDSVEGCGPSMTVNGAEPSRPRGPWLGESRAAMRYCEQHVPAQHVYVVGDNATGSTDSRHFGPIPLRDVFGRASFIVVSRDAERAWRDVR